MRRYLKSEVYNERKVRCSTSKKRFFPDKEKAQRAIMAGLVIVDEKK